jgi:putative flavoprotein involved in K+ transport
MTITVTESPSVLPEQPEDGLRVLTRWVEAFGAALSSHDAAAISVLFQPGATVRDLLALSWDLRNAVGRDEIVELLAGAASVAPLQISVRPGAPVAGSTEDEVETLATFVRFTTASGSGEGHVSLARDPDGTWRATGVVLALSALDSHPELVDDLRPVGRLHAPVADRVGWHEVDREFETEDPAVVIIGAGHNGLMIAARLQALGIPALVIENHERVGDNWRKRYTSLALHTPLVADQLPYMPFPSTWTRFTPKDKLGDFLESYARLLDLAVWTSSRAENVHFDEALGRWTLDVVRADGSRRHMTPNHLVMATGMNGAPRRPELPGEARFDGEVLHAAEYNGYRPWAGKRVAVVGSGVSGHDIAQDLAEHGVDVTMIQRSGTVVLDASSFHKVMYSTHLSGKYTLEDGDLINAAVPFGELPKYGAAQLAAANALDRELLDGLAAAGFELSDGPDGQGVLGLIFGLNTTGYYYNAGASQLIADGTIKLRHGGVVEFTETGVTLDDGSAVDADLVVFATGYEPPTTAVRALLGDDVADAVGEFARVGEDREYGRLWRHCGLDRLWFIVSLSLEHGRFYSKLLALQIAAIEAGTITANTVSRSRPASK